MTARLVVLASGSGTNLAAVIAACTTGALNAQVVGIVSDNSDAGALERAGSIPTVVVERKGFATRADYDDALAQAVAAWVPDLVVLAGFMRLLGGAFLDHFPRRVINLHPALPGDLPGLHAIERAFHESRTTGRSTTGVMVHFVPDEGIDSGPVITSQAVPIKPGDTLDTLAARIHAVEHQLLIEAIAQVLASPSQSPPTYSGGHQP